MICHSQSVVGETVLSIDNSTTMAINDGDTVELSCDDISITDNGILTLNGGTLKNRGRIISSDGGKFIKISGRDEKCYKSYYIIPGKNGTAAIICL